MGSQLPIAMPLESSIAPTSRLDSLVASTRAGRVFIPSRARGTDTLVRREPRISAEIPSSGCAKLSSHAARSPEKACDVLEASRGRFVQTMEHGAGSPGVARGRVLLCKLIVKTCPQITVNGPVSASLILDNARPAFFCKPQMRRGLASAQHAVPTPASTAPRAREGIKTCTRDVRWNTRCSRVMPKSRGKPMPAGNSA
jgi:hypothetical protein